MAEAGTFQLPTEFFEGSYGKIALSREEAAQRLSIIGIIDGYPALLLDRNPARENERVELSVGMVTRYHLYMPAEYTLQGKPELVAQMETEIDVPDDDSEPAYSYFGLMEFGDSLLLKEPVPYDQVAWDALMPLWKDELERRQREGKLVGYAPSVYLTDAVQ